jgi:hypothetical protein
LARRKESGSESLELSGAGIKNGLNDSVQLGLKMLEAAVDQAGSAAESVFYDSEVFFDDMYNVMEEFLAGGKKAKNEAIDSLRKLAAEALGE